MKKKLLIAILASTVFAAGLTVALKSHDIKANLFLANIEALADTESNVAGSCSDEGECILTCDNTDCGKTYRNIENEGKASYSSGKCNGCGGTSFTGK